MKKSIYVLIIIALLISCTQQTDKTIKQNQQSKKVNLFTDPNTFIGKHKSKAMVLGVLHFSNPGLGTYKPKFPFNILEEKRQSELDTLLAKISEYKPTKILLEWNQIKMDSITNDRFKKYTNGEFSVDDKSNEVYQIGFKLAKKLDHNKVYCSDASADWFGVELDWDNYDEDTYLKSRGQYGKANRYDYESFYLLGDSLKTTQSLSEHLIWLNNPENRLKDHQAYLTSIIEGAGDNYLGADAVANWYRRNLKIFANVYNFTNFEKEDRLLLIYGAGHVWQLRQYFIGSPDYEYVEVNDFLKN
jgi:Family of unknown function (DUF5694)